MKIITEVCFPQRFMPPLGSIFPLFNLWIEPNSFQNPDGTGMLNTILEEFPSHIPNEALNQTGRGKINKKTTKKQCKMLKMGVISKYCEFHHNAQRCWWGRCTEDAVNILLMMNSKALEVLCYPWVGNTEHLLQASPELQGTFTHTHKPAEQDHWLYLLYHLFPAAGTRQLCWFHLLISCLCLFVFSCSKQVMLGSSG